jgi:dethiobiotin synthetase
VTEPARALLPLTGVVLITGTGTDIGKTMVTAALAGAALAAGARVCVVKPVQTGVRPGEPGDVAEVVRLLGPEPNGLVTHEWMRLPEPLAPQAAARRAGVPLPPLAEHAARIAALADDFDLVLVEGAGGLLVRLDDEGGTLADLAVLLRKVLPRNSGASQATVAAGDGLERGVGVVLVTGVELGTLNVTELTVEALRARGIAILGLVVGRWPAQPGTVERGNLADLPRLTDVRLLGLIPEGPALPVSIETGVP